MSDEGDPFSDADLADSGDDEELEKVRRELDQRERGLSDYANELDEREKELNERASELRKQKKQLEERASELDGREKRIEELEAELDDRRIALEDRERELSERASELDEKERTLQEYVNESVRETVREAISAGMGGDSSPSHFGRIGSLVLGLVGITLVIGGVLNGFAGEISMVPTVFASDAANLGVTVLLLFSGLAANLAAIGD